MKIIFEFDTESENFDRTELEIHQQAWNMASCLNDILNQLRSWYKYGEREELPVDEVRDRIIDIINENVNMEKMGY